MEKYQILFESSRDAIMILEPPEWLFTAGNTATIEMFGAKSKNEFTSKNPGELSPEYQPDGQPSSEKSMKMINSAMKTGSQFFEWTHKRMNGENFPATVLLSKVELNGKKLLLATVRDITESKKKDKELKKYQEHLQELVEERTLELRESEEKYRTLTNNINIGIYRSNADPKGKFLEVNPAFVKMFGYKNKNEILQQSVFEFYQDPEGRNNFYQQIIKEGYVKSKELLLKKKDGENIIVSVSTVAIKNENGEVIYFDGIAQDITESEKVEEKLKADEIQLRKLNKTKDRLFSIIAHDLTTPFNSIIGLTNLIVDEFDSFKLEEIKKLLVAVNNDANETYELLTNLLNWSRAQREKIRLISGENNIYKIIEKNRSLFTSVFNKKEIKINIEVDKKDYGFFDYDTINTVFRNLISNALKFTQRGGEITISSVKSENEIQVKFSDNGIGISQKNKDKLFKLDSEFSIPGTENEKGTGLGLILCKEFVNLNNGEISVVSEYKKGSDFIVTLPINDWNKE